jgi:hypothetical protein
MAQPPTKCRGFDLESFSFAAAEDRLQSSVRRESYVRLTVGRRSMEIRNLAGAEFDPDTNLGHSGLCHGARRPTAGLRHVVAHGIHVDANHDRRGQRPKQARLYSTRPFSSTV